MAWYLWAVLSMFANSFENIIDKVVLIKEPKKIDVLAAMFYRNLGFFVCTAIIGLTGLMGKMSFVMNVPLFILAIIYPLASFSYDYFLRNLEVSRASAVSYTFPLFFLFFDNLFFHLRFSPVEVIGVLLLVGGAVMFSYDIANKKSSFSWKSTFWMFVKMAISLYMYIVFKIYDGTVNGVSFYFSVWAVIILLYVVLLFATGKYRKLRETATTNHFVGKTFIAKAFDALSSTFYMQALALVSLTAVSAFTSLTPMVMLMILACVAFFTKIRTDEDFSKRTFIWKILGALLLVFGSLCLFK